jgi:hypothetical protein
VLLYRRRMSIETTPAFARKFSALIDAAGSPAARRIAAEIETALSPPRFRIAASTVSSWMRGGACPRDEVPLEPALDYLERVASARVGEEEARRLRKNCESAYSDAVAARHPPREGPLYLDSAVATTLEFAGTVVSLARDNVGDFFLGMLTNAASERLKTVLARRKQPQPLSEQDVTLLAEVAVMMRCQDLNQPLPRLDSPRNHRYRAGDGRWVLYFRDDTTGQQFFVCVPPGRPSDKDVLVDVVMPGIPLGARREWDLMNDLGHRPLPPAP